MSSSYNTPCSKHKLVVSIYSNTETSLAMSTLAVWCRVVRSRDFSAPPYREPNQRPVTGLLADLRYIPYLLKETVKFFEYLCCAACEVAAETADTPSQARRRGWASLAVSILGIVVGIGTLVLVIVYFETGFLVEAVAVIFTPRSSQFVLINSAFTKQNRTTINTKCVRYWIIYT